MSNPKGIQVGDCVQIDGDHPEGRFAPGKRYVREVAPIPGKASIGLGKPGGTETDPVVAWIPATSSAITEHKRHS